MLSEMAKENKSVIIALTESHLRPAILDAEIQIEGFQLFRADRLEGTKKGGVIIYVINELASDAVVIASGSNGIVEWLALYFRRKNMVFITVYRPPTCPSAAFTSVLDEIATKIEEIGPPMPTVIMNGDFNLPRMNWEDETVGNGGSLIKQQHSLRLLEMTNNFTCDQCVNFPT